MENSKEEDEKESQDLPEETVEALTAHFRRTSRGRIVDLPRWAQ